MFTPDAMNLWNVLRVKGQKISHGLFVNRRNLYNSLVNGILLENQRLRHLAKGNISTTDPYQCAAAYHLRERFMQHSPVRLSMVLWLNNADL